MRMPIRTALFSFTVGALLLLSPFCAHAREVVGMASVVDGDTLDIHGHRVRLHGVDAPESGQACQRDGRSYRCGQQAALALADLIGRRTVRCEEKDRDRYGRIVAVCAIGGENVNAWLVRQGHAVVYRQYSQDFVTQEAQARAERAGIWAGTFDMPWDYRRGRRTATSTPSLNDNDALTSTNCRIKGNINGKGERIYHLPGGDLYYQTKIAPSSGERWFCTEGEAQAAGWRRAGR